MSEYGKIAQDEVVSRWEDDVDELQQEDWEDVMGGPDDRHFEQMDDAVDPDYQPPEYEDDGYLPPKGNDGGTQEDKMEPYDFADDEFDEYDVMMIEATKRQEEIVAWLADSLLAQPLKGGSRSDFLIREGAPVRLLDGALVELLSWLELEGFEDRLMVSGYVVTTALDRKGTGDVMIFRKTPVVKAPFVFDELPDVAVAPEAEELNAPVSDDDIPF